MIEVTFIQRNTNEYLELEYVPRLGEYVVYRSVCGIVSKVEHFFRKDVRKTGFNTGNSHITHTVTIEVE